MLADIVSKNGNLLLSVPLRGDGTIDEDEVKILEDLAAWMKVNGEAIFGTRPWRVFGEGPPCPQEGTVSEHDARPYTSADIRFTTKGSTLFAIGMVWPADGRLILKTFANDADPANFGEVKLLGSSKKVKWSRTAAGLELELPKGVTPQEPFVVRFSTKPAVR